MTDLSIILRSLRARRLATITTIAMVAVAVALMLTLLTMKDSGRRAFLRGGGNMHLIVSADPSPLTAVLNGVFYANPPRAPLTMAKYEQIRDSFPWAWAIPTQLGDSYRGYPAIATTREFLESFQPDPVQPWVFTEGRAFEKPFEIVLGAAAARGTGASIGSTIALTHGAPGPRSGDPGAAPHHHEHDDFPFTVVGILEESGTPHDRLLITDLTSAWILHAHDRRHLADPTIRTTVEADLTDADRLITGILLRVPTRAGRGVSAAMQQAHDMLRRDTSIVVAEPEQQVDALLAIVGNVDVLLIAMAAVVMACGATGIMLALVGSMEQRRRQIAVLRVLGCSRGRVLSLVLTESALIAMIGVAAGVALSVVGCFGVSVALRRAFGLIVGVEPSLTWILVVAAATIILAAIAGTVPAAIAYRTSVANHLRPFA